MAHPIDERGEPLPLGAIEDVSALRAIGDQASPLQRAQMLRDGRLRHAAAMRQLSNTDLVGPDDPLEDGPPGWVGERAHYGVERRGSEHDVILAMTNALVNTNM